MSSKKLSTVPGLEPTSEEDGNLCDIANAGSLHEFLLGLHKKFGPIASFWWGELHVISIASADLFEEHRHLFDKPLELFEMFQPLLGPKSMQNCYQEAGKCRRRHYDKTLDEEALKRLFPQLQEVADEVSEKMADMFDRPKIPLTEFTFMYSVKAVLQTLFGSIMKDDSVVMDFRKKFDLVWSEMESRLTQFPTLEREEAFQENKKVLEEAIRKILGDRKASPPGPGEEILVDSLISFSEDEDQQLADALTYTVGGFHTTGNLLTWALYFVAKHPEVDGKIYQEINEVLGSENTNNGNISDLVYLKQVLDETLRCSVIASWAARFQDTESKLGEHTIPKRTPVIHALGVALQDDKVWPNPEKFDPDRFSKENAQQRSQLWFSPFGFAGERACPAKYYTYAEATVAMVTFLRNYKIHLSNEDQTVTPVFGLVTYPKEDILVTISKR